MCDSLECGVYYERHKTAHELATCGALLTAAERVLCDDDSESGCE